MSGRPPIEVANSGTAVAEAARGSALPTQAQAACGHGEQGAANKNEAHGKSGQAHGASTAGRAFGQETAQEAKGLGDATPEQRRQFGEDTAGEAQDLGGAPSAAPESSPAAPDAQGGPETGQTKSGAGQAMGDQASGGRKP